MEKLGHMKAVIGLTVVGELQKQQWLSDTY
jgi:hypothetical protein